MRRDAVILFSGNARREETRKGLPPRFLGRLHESIAETVRSVGGVDLIVVSEQIDPDRLGARVRDALAACFDAGYANVALLAGDVVGLTRDVLGDAFAALTSAPAVVGESPDGGFYFAAFRGAPSVDWESLPWCTADMFASLTAALGECATLPPLRDVDSLGDAFRAAAALHDPRVRVWLLSLLQVRRYTPSSIAAIPLRSSGACLLRGPPGA